MIRSILALVSLAFLGLATAWTSNGYYDRYNVAPMRADQDVYGFGSLFEANRRTFQTSRMNTNGEYNRNGMDYYPRSDYSGYRNYNDYDYGNNNGRFLTRYRPNRRYDNGYGYDYGYSGRYGNSGSHWDSRDYTNGSYDYSYNNRYNSRYNNRYSGNNDYWSYSQSPRNGGYGPNYDSYRHY